MGWLASLFSAKQKQPKPSDGDYRLFADTPITRSAANGNGTQPPSNAIQELSTSLLKKP